MSNKVKLVTHDGSSRGESARTNKTSCSAVRSTLAQSSPIPPKVPPYEEVVSNDTIPTLTSRAAYATAQTNHYRVYLSESASQKPSRMPNSGAEPRTTNLASCPLPASAAHASTVLCLHKQCTTSLFSTLTIVPNHLAYTTISQADHRS